MQKAKNSNAPREFSIHAGTALILRQIRRRGAEVLQICVLSLDLGTRPDGLIGPSGSVIGERAGTNARGHEGGALSAQAERVAAGA